MPTPIATAVAPVIANQLLGDLTFGKNQRAYQDAQERANQFAREERERAQQYNSLENQFAQMQRVGMNPNLLTGQAFEGTSPMQNQSVAPPQQQPAQFSPEGLSQIGLNKANEKKSSAEAITTEMIRDNLVKTQGAQYEFTVAQKNVSEAQLQNTKKEFEVLDATVENIKQTCINLDAQTQNMRENTAKLRELQGTWRRNADKEFEHIVSEIAVNDAQKAQLLASRDNLLSLAENVREDTLYKRDTHNARVIEQNNQTNRAFWEYKGAKISANNLFTSGKISQWQLGQYESYGELNNVISTVDAGARVVDRLISLSPAERAKRDLKDFVPFSSNSSNPSSAPLPNSFSSGSFMSE